MQNTPLKSTAISLFWVLFISHNGITQVDNILAMDISKVKKIDTLLHFSEKYADQYNLDTALIYGNKALNLSIDEQLLSKEAKSHYHLGYAYDLNGQLISAINHYEDSRKLYEKLGNTEEVANCMNAKGVAAYFKGDFGLALEYLTELYDKNGNISKAYDTQSSLSLIHI